MGNVEEVCGVVVRYIKGFGLIWGARGARVRCVG